MQSAERKNERKEYQTSDWNTPGQTVPLCQYFGLGDNEARVDDTGHHKRDQEVVRK
jgi:hypothetical protein